MAQRINQMQMETLSTSLGKKPKKKTTQGKVVPVMKQSNPYTNRSWKPKATPAPARPNANQLGAQQQQRTIENQAPVSTALNISYESDPVLARIRAMGTQDVANARAEAEALRKQAIIDSGLTDVGAEIGVDQSTLQAAAANPFSTQATLQRTQQERGRQLDESMNQQNLFYGGHRATQLEDLARSGAQAQAGLQGDIRSLLGGINTGVTERETAAALAEQEALAQIAEQERQAALQQSFLDALYAPEVTDIGASLGAAPQTNPLLPDYEYQPIQAAPEPVLTPEEELMLALGFGDGSGFGHYAV